jgi:HEAT repeats/HEAT repeat
MGLLRIALTELVLMVLVVVAVTSRAGASATGGDRNQKSRARAVGHTWLLFALLSGPVVAVALIGHGLDLGPGDAVGALLLAAIFAVSVRQATLAYSFARTLRPSRGLWGAWAAPPGSPVLDDARDAGDIESIATLLRDPDVAPGLRRKASHALATTKPGGGRSSAWRPSTDPRAIPILAELVMNDPDPAVRRSAVFGLRGCQDVAVSGPLIHALSDPDKATRMHAVLGLGELRSREAVEALGRLLSDRYCQARAAKALVKIRDGRAISLLEEAATNERSSRRRERLLEAARNLESDVGLHSNGR